jgi:DNA-binding XRE family transcriptional regulator
MPRKSNASDALPAVVQTRLRELGQNLSIARKRRRETVKEWAQRIGVSDPTLIRMEKGDPGVSMGVYATALWLMGRDQALADLAAPEHDMGALELAVRAVQTRAVRKRASLYRGAQSQTRQVDPVDQDLSRDEGL